MHLELVHTLDLEPQAHIQNQDLDLVVIRGALDWGRITEVGQAGDIQAQDQALIQDHLGRAHIQREVTEAGLSLVLAAAAIRGHLAQGHVQVAVMVVVLVLRNLLRLTRDLQAALLDILAVAPVLALQALVQLPTL